MARLYLVDGTNVHDTHTYNTCICSWLCIRDLYLCEISDLRFTNITIEPS
jgi:hypothetical protein